MLPRLDGVALCRKLREEFQNPVPVLMLTARDPVDDRVQGLAVGADDYLAKPFSFRELDARIQALVRRAQAGRCRGCWPGKTCRWTRAPRAHGGKAGPST
ncbi:response regulator [Paracidovorax cattleyae]